MKIVIATPLYPPEIGGPATYVKLLEEGLPKKGIEVDVVKFSEVRHLPKIIRHYAYYRRVLRAARDADIVLALDPVSVGLPAMRAAQRVEKPFVVKIVGDYAWEQGVQRFGITQSLDEFVANERVPRMVRLLRKIQARVAHAAENVIVPSEYLKTIVTAWGVPKRKIQVIYNAVPAEDIGSVPRSIEVLPRPLVVSVGRLVPWKGMEGVIDAVASLRSQGSQTSLAIVGDGPDLVLLIAHAEQKLKNDYVFTGALSHADTLAVMKSADVFVLNSSYEGLSHLLIEAFQLGVAIVATNVGGNPEVITDGKEGLLVPYGDTSAIVKAFMRILSDNTLWSHVSTQTKESAKRFSTEVMLSTTTSLLQKL